MPHGGPPEDDLGPTQGIAGGPGPTPPGFEDGTPQPGATHASLPSEQAEPEEEAEGAPKRRGGGAAPGAPGEGAGERREEEPPEHVYDDPPEGKDPPPERGA